MPRAWLRPGKASRFEDMPTELGPVTLRTKLSADGKRLDVRFDPRFHTRPSRIVLHVPSVEGLRTVRLNGKPIAAGGGKLLTIP
jgi:hypothetical protein